MKKNIAMRVAAFLFILTMISTCAFATTFAKYTTSDKADDTARVAKWGVVLAVTGDEAFSKAYKDTAVTETDATLTVLGDEKVIAPGTNGTLLTISIKGSPEVDTKVTVDFSMDLENWEINSVEYCPLVFKVNGNPIQINDTDVTSIDALESAVEKAVETAIAGAGQETQAGSKVGVRDYNAKDELNSSITVTWEWAFEVEGTPEQKEEANKKDTALGDAAAKGTAPSIKFNIACTVEQVD